VSVIHPLGSSNADFKIVRFVEFAKTLGSVKVGALKMENLGQINVGGVFVRGVINA